MCNCLVAIGGHFRFGPARAAEFGSLVAQILAFDVAVTVHHATSLARAESRHSAVDGEIETFRDVISKVTAVVRETSAVLATFAVDLRASADTARETANIVVNAFELASVNVSAANDVANQMTRSNHEVGELSVNGTKIADKTIDQVTVAGQSMNALHGVTKEIVDVSRIIKEIANQTNMLSLNATIEAARAGNLGQGFAVVAAEIKTLADDTKRATTQIESLVESVQSAVQSSIHEIIEISATIDAMKRASQSILRSVEDQSLESEGMYNALRATLDSVIFARNEVLAIGSSANHGVAMANELVDWTEKLQTFFLKLESGVGSFFDRVQVL